MSYLVRPFQFIVLLAYAFEFDELAQLGDNHAFGYFCTTGEYWLVVRGGLSDVVAPDLTVRTFAVPTEVAVGNRMEGKVLKAAQEAVFFRNLNFLAEDLDRYQFFVRIEQVAGIKNWWGLVESLLVHVAGGSTALPVAE